MTHRRRLFGLLMSVAFVDAAWCEQDVFLVNGSGKFIQFQLHSREVEALWDLWNVPGMAEILPQGPMDGLALEGLAFDPLREVVYLLSPKEARMDEWGRQGYRVAAVRFPGMELLAETMSARTEEERVALSSLATDDEPGNHLISGVVSRDGGRMLVLVSTVNAQPSDEIALFVLDPVTRDATPPFRVPSVRAWLAGKRVVTMELKNGSTTGRVVLYEPATDEITGTIESPLLAGAASTLVGLPCYVGDTLVLLGAEHRPFLLETETGEVYGIRAGFTGDDWTHCLVRNGGS